MGGHVLKKYIHIGDYPKFVNPKRRYADSANPRRGALRF